jgi:hypothetical protein
MTLDRRVLLECGQPLAAFVHTVAPHANHVPAIGVGEALDSCRVLTEVCFKPLQFGGSKSAALLNW